MKTNTIKRLVTICLSILTHYGANADDTDTSINFSGLYNAIMNNEPDTAYRWRHRAILYKAAKVDLRTDTGMLLSDRMQLFWEYHKTDRVSLPYDSSVSLTELLPLSLQQRASVFLLDAVRWQLDLNTMDFTRRQTLLDVLEETYRNYIKQDDPEWLREYKKILVSAGAKTFHELDFAMKQLYKRYEKIRPPAYGYFPVCRNGKWGWVNAENEVIIPLKYQEIGLFTANYFLVSDDGVNYYFVSRKSA